MHRSIVKLATVKYRIKGKADPSSIYIRLKNGRNLDLEVSTDLKVPKKYWSSSKGQVKVVSDFNHRSVNSKLMKLNAYILDQFNIDNTNGLLINNTWLKEQINLFFNRPNNNDKDSEVYFVSFIEKFIDYSSKRKGKRGKPLAKRTIQHYSTTKNKVVAFEKFKNIRLRLMDIDLKFHSDFEEFLTIEQHLIPNTVGGYIDDIKLFCRRAENRGLNVNPEYKHPDFYTPTNETADIYLTIEEINQIFNHDFSDSERLDNVRDWFIIGLWTGLRISDFLELDKSNLGKGYIEVQTLKTGFPVIVPLHPQVKEVLEKRKGDFPKQISHQKFNEYVKEVCQLAGITEVVYGAKMVMVKTKLGEVSRKEFGNFPKYELVSSHICRRSFATNHYNKLDTLTIMKITGHKTEKQYLDYIKVTPKQHADKLKEYWDSQIVNG